MKRWLAPIGVGVLAAVLAWVGLQVSLHLWMDHVDHHLVLDLLKYNIQQGRLVPLPVGPAASPTPVPTPVPTPKKP